LTSKVEDAEMALIVRYLPPQAAVEWLTDLANLRGGPDNITVLITEARRSGGERQAGQWDWHSAWPWRLGLLAAAMVASLTGVAVLAWGHAEAAGMLAVLAAVLASLSLLARRRTVGVPSTIRCGKGPYTTAHISHTPHQLDSIDESLSDMLAQVRDVEEEKTIAEVQDLLDRARAHRAQSGQAEACQIYAQLTSKLLKLLRNYDGQGDLFS
jgi:protein phosphatase